MRKLILFFTLLSVNNIWGNYESISSGEKVDVNDWILIGEVITRDKEKNALGKVYKYCVITEIVDETKKPPSAYATKNKPHPLNAVGFAWFVVNGTPVQSFTTRYIFRDALTGRRDTTLPEGCEIKLQIK